MPGDDWNAGIEAAAEVALGLWGDGTGCPRRDDGWYNVGWNDAATKAHDAILALRRPTPAASAGSGGGVGEAWDGLPQNPERDGWHWLAGIVAGEPEPTEWCCDQQQWHYMGWCEPEFVSPRTRYLGPCALPAALTATEHRAAEAERDAARLRAALDPRLWTAEMSAAWHCAIPDVHDAFAALRAIIRAPTP